LNSSDGVNHIESAPKINPFSGLGALDVPQAAIEHMFD